MTVRRITAVTAPRDFRLKPENIRAGLLELQAIQASIIEQWNSSAFPVLNSLRGEALSNGLDGGTILIDASSKPEEQGGLFWNALRERPNTIKEQCRTLGMDVAAMRRVLDLKQDKVSASSSSETDLTTVKKWIKQIAADTIFSNKAQGTEYTENLFTGSATQTNAWSLLDLVDGILAAMGGGLVRDATSYTFSGRNYLNAATTIHGGLLALDTSLKTVDDKWTVSGANLYRAAGNVGIGTANPTAKFVVTDPTPDAGMVRFEGNDGIVGIQGGNKITCNRPGNFYITMTNAQDGCIVLEPSATGGKAQVLGDFDLTGSLTFDGSGPSIASIIDDDTMGTASATSLATSESIKAYCDAQNNVQDFDFQGDAGGAQSLLIDSQTFTFEGGAGVTTTGSAAKISIATDVSQPHVTSVGTLTSLVVDGSVGIGTTSPAQPLHIQSDNNNSDPSVLIDNNNADGTCGLGFRSGVSDNYTIGVAKVGTNFRIANGPNLSTAPSLLDINRDTGSVGIGTTTPAGKLTVVDPASDAVVIRADGSDGIFRVQGGNKITFSRDSVNYITCTGSSSSFMIETGGGGNPRVTVASDGKVGIGTTTPAKTLDVDGDLKVSGKITLGGVEYTPPGSDGSAGQVIKTDGSGNWDWVDNSGGGSIAVVDCTDVTTSGLSSGDFLLYNGTVFKNKTASGDASLNSSGVFTIANDAINAAKIAANAVGSSEIADNAVSKAKMQDDSVGKAEVKSDENLAFAGHIIVAYAGEAIDEKSAVKAAGYDSSTGRVKVELCGSVGKAMGIAVETASAEGNSIEVMISGVTTVSVYPNSNPIALEAELSPRNDGSGQVVQAVGASVGQVIGYLLEAVDSSEATANNPVDKKIWVQPC